MPVCKQCAHARRAQDRERRWCCRNRAVVRAEAIACAAYALSARALLESVGRADRRLEEMSQRAARYRAMAMRATSSTEAERISGSSGRSRVAENMDKFIDLTRDIEREAEELRARQARARALIAGLSTPIGQEVIELRYLSGMRWGQIAAKVDRERRQLNRIHGRALQEMQAMMDREQENFEKSPNVP